ncbi:helix-turn-helix domain-containing protein [Schumannella soli]|nr:helix-turn-helix domain-containing protein [Schumannella soli]
MTTVHLKHRSTSSHDAEAMIREFSQDLRLDSPGRLRHSVESHSDHRLRVMSLAFVGDLTTVADTEHIVAAVTTRGAIDWSVGETRGGGATPWLQAPGTRATSRVSTAAEQAIALPVAPFERLGRAMFGDPAFRVRFDRLTPATPQLEDYFRTTLRYASSLARTRAFESDLVRADLHRLLCVSLLETFGPREETRRRARTAADRRTRYQRAAAFLDDHVSLPITIDDAAQAAGVASAELAELFVAFSPAERTPQQYLRRARVSAARRDLVEFDGPRQEAVGSVATRWGFASMRTFVREFHAVTGETPWDARRH